MRKLDHTKFADKLLIAIGKKPKEDTSSEEDVSDIDDEESEPGKLGRVLASAIKHSDYEAIEEAIRNICNE